MVEFQIDEGLAALRQLLDLRDRGKFSDAEFLQSVAEGGPIVSIEVQDRSTGGALHLCKIYKPSRALREFLAAVAARSAVVEKQEQREQEHGEGDLQMKRGE